MILIDRFSFGCQPDHRDDSGVVAMIHAILLDINQSKVDDDEYAVTFSGSLMECQAQTNHDGAFSTWEKSDFYEVSSTEVELSNPMGGADSGRLVGLDEASPFARRGRLLRIGAPVLTGIAAGLLVSAALSRTDRTRTARRRKLRS